MPIPVEYQNRRVYHFTHIDNLESILRHDLLSPNKARELGIGHTNIAYDEIQQRRSNMIVPCGPGGVVHDYVPLYFCKRSPMLLAVVQNKIADEQLIIYLEFSISILEEYDCVITDSSANANHPPNFFTNPQNLDAIDWNAVETWRWGSQYDRLGELPVKQKKMAELLVHEQINSTSVRQIVVWNEDCRDIVEEIHRDVGVTVPKIAYGGRDYYYIDQGTTRPPVTGPYFIKKACQETIDHIIERLGSATAPQFDNLHQLLNALQDDLESVPETAELVGLETENRMHYEDVGQHTLTMVEQLKNLSEYEEMNSTDELLVEIAAFLHDIGKGPKARWVNNQGRQKVDPDHPIKALPMIERILTEDVRTMCERSARMITKLVCYHDLIGGILYKGRRPEELITVIKYEDVEELDERLVNMLVAVSKADILAIDPSWNDEDKVKQLIDDIFERFYVFTQQKK